VLACEESEGKGKSVVTFVAPGADSALRSETTVIGMSEGVITENVNHPGGAEEGRRTLRAKDV